MEQVGHCMRYDSQSCIKSIKLVHFRNYERAELDSEGKSVVILGKNGSGKTNILEALSLLSKSTGIRNANAECMQNNWSSTPWTLHYKVLVDKVSSSISISRKDNRRSILVDGKASTYGTLHKTLCIIWLIPQLDHILLKAPSERLKFLDRVVHIFDEDYALHVVKYEKAKRDRKRVLLESPDNHHWLSVLEDIMSVSGIYIASTRLRVLTALKNIADRAVIRAPFLKCIVDVKSEVFPLLDTEDAIGRYKEQLHRNRSIDAVKATTSFGIHNDNFQIIHRDKKIVASNCSTGEQKILLLSLLLMASTSKYLEHGQAPIVLLDDIMSHLDKYHKEELILSISGIGCQMWITDVDEKNFEEFHDNFKYFHICENKIHST